MKKIDHGFIAPISLLDKIPQDSRFHLVLAQLMDRPAYASFYREKSERGDYIIMDNGAFESGVPFNNGQMKRAVDLAGFQPNCIVAPDYPNEDWGKTISSAERTIESVSKIAGVGTTVMIVPQSKDGDYDGWMHCYGAASVLAAASDIVSHMGMSILGIPNAFHPLTGTKDISFNRTFASLELLRRGIACDYAKHHYLGCGDPRELLLMRSIGLADSNDSSTAIWHGWLRTKFDNSAGGLVGGKSLIEVDFDLAAEQFVLREKRDACIDHNIRYLQSLLA